MKEIKEGDLVVFFQNTRTERTYGSTNEMVGHLRNSDVLVAVSVCGSMVNCAPKGGSEDEFYSYHLDDLKLVEIKPTFSAGSLVKFGGVNYRLIINPDCDSVLEYPLSIKLFEDVIIDFTEEGLMHTCHTKSMLTLVESVNKEVIEINGVKYKRLEE